MSNTGDDFDRDLTPAPACPTTVKIAGIAWIVFGGLILLNLLVFLVLMFGLAAAGPQGSAGAAVAGGVCGGLLLGLFGAAFIYVGIQSIQGTARDTLGNGIGSIVFGALNLGSGALQAGAGQSLQAGVGFLVGAGLVAAGVLALVGRADYKAWRKGRNPGAGAQPRP